MTLFRQGWPALLVALVLGAGTACGVRSAAGAAADLIPAATINETPSPTDSLEVAVLAAGCFWGVQGVYQHVAGVRAAVSGYAGGESTTADYETVSTGRTRHAESVQVTFDPRVITYGTILRIYFSVAHDPTQLNRQGPDVGPQYRSTIFPRGADQARIAEAYIAQLDRAKAFPSAIVTTIEPARDFYVAEDHHQDFLENNPTNPYIVFNDLGKVENLKRSFPERFRAQPVLVSASTASLR